MTRSRVRSETRRTPPQSREMSQAQNLARLRRSERQIRGLWLPRSSPARSSNTESLRSSRLTIGSNRSVCQPLETPAVRTGSRDSSIKPPTSVKRRQVRSGSVLVSLSSRVVRTNLLRRTRPKRRIYTIRSILVILILPRRYLPMLWQTLAKTRMTTRVPTLPLPTALVARPSLASSRTALRMSAPSRASCAMSLLRNRRALWLLARWQR